MKNIGTITQSVGKSFNSNGYRINKSAFFTAVSVSETAFFSKNIFFLSTIDALNFRKAKSINTALHISGRFKSSFFKSNLSLSAKTIVSASGIVIPDTKTIIPVTETIVSVTKTIIPEVKTIIPLSETIIPDTETVIPVTKTIVSEVKTIIPEAETIVSDTETAIPITKTSMPALKTIQPLLKNCITEKKLTIN